MTDTHKPRRRRYKTQPSFFRRHRGRIITTSTILCSFLGIFMVVGLLLFGGSPESSKGDSADRKVATLQSDQQFEKWACETHGATMQTYRHIRCVDGKAVTWQQVSGKAYLTANMDGMEIHLGDLNNLNE